MKPIYTLDLETDPFLAGRVPVPFVAGFYDGDTFKHCWGKRCLDNMRAYLMTREPGIIYVHNGGKFDLYYMMDWLVKNEPISIIHNRIVKANLLNRHEFRDSFAIFPFALKMYKKDEIDYQHMEAPERNKWKSEILSYLRHDCKYLWELASDFVDRFGLNLTIGATSMKQFKKLYKFECFDKETDAVIRNDYYYGGRVQCFEKGLLRTDRQFKVYDINQSYPNAMRAFQHPIGFPSRYGSNITENTFFVKVYGRNNNAFPMRDKDGLHFDVTQGEFCVTIHEYNAAIELGLFKPIRVLETIDFDQHSSFELFTDKFTTLRRIAQEQKDDTGSIFYKYIGNSCYGKFSQCPEYYYDYILTDDSADHSAQGYERTELITFANLVMWKKHSTEGSYYNVATGASITGAARSVLMRGLSQSQRPVYCDTDSIICEHLNAEIDATKLGAWKLEKEGKTVVIAGRKMYVLFADTFRHPLKLATKGVRLRPSQVFRIARGKRTVIYEKDAPSFNMLSGEVNFLKREVGLT